MFDGKVNKFTIISNEYNLIVYEVDLQQPVLYELINNFFIKAYKFNHRDSMQLFRLECYVSARLNNSIENNLSADISACVNSGQLADDQKYNLLKSNQVMANEFLFWNLLTLDEAKFNATFGVLPDDTLNDLVDGLMGPGLVASLIKFNRKDKIEHILKLKIILSRNVTFQKSRKIIPTFCITHQIKAVNLSALCWKFYFQPKA